MEGKMAGSNGNGYVPTGWERVSNKLLTDIKDQKENLVVVYAKPEEIEAVHITAAQEKYNTALPDARKTASRIFELLIEKARPEVIEAVHITAAQEKYKNASPEEKIAASRIFELLIEKARPEVITAEHLKVAKQIHSQTLFKAVPEETGLADKMFQTLLKKAPSNVLDDLKDNKYKKAFELQENARQELENRNRKPVAGNFLQKIFSRQAEAMLAGRVVG
jgi:hypothetical protein